MSVDYATTATRLAQIVANVWKLASDEGLSLKGRQELIKGSIKATQLLLKLAENHHVSDAGFKNRVLKQVQTDLEQEKNRLLEGV